MQRLLQFPLSSVSNEGHLQDRIGGYPVYADLSIFVLPPWPHTSDTSASPDSQSDNYELYYDMTSLRSPVRSLSWPWRIHVGSCWAMPCSTP